MGHTVLQPGESEEKGEERVGGSKYRKQNLTLLCLGWELLVCYINRETAE